MIYIANVLKALEAIGWIWLLVYLSYRVIRAITHGDEV